MRAFLSRRGPVVALTAVVVAIATFLLTRGDDAASHRVVAVVTDARSLYAGVRIKTAGQDVGAIEALKPLPDGRVRLTLRIDDDRVWPIGRHDRFKVRYGGSVAFAARYLRLDRAATQTDPVADGGRLSAGQFVAPVEVDEAVSTFDSRTRADVRDAVTAGGRALGPAAPGLSSALDEGPAAIRQARALMDDLGADQDALSALIRSGDLVSAALDATDPGIGSLLEGAAGTLTALGTQSANLRRSLAQVPETLATARRTLGRADSTLKGVADVTDRLDPGVRQLRAIAPSLSRTLVTLDRVGPDARRTLGTLRAGSPALQDLLATAEPLAPKIASIGRQAAPQIGCVRPYAPEVTGFASTWGQVSRASDGKDKYARIALQSYPFVNFTPLTAGQFDKIVPLDGYAFPRPPGLNADQPWFQPQCGAGEDSVDPEKDPEARNFDPSGRPLLSVGDGDEVAP